MKYKIIKKEFKSLSVSNLNSTQKVDIYTKTWYEAKRKGRIFGFWHTVGHECDWVDGTIYSHTANTLEEMENYIIKYHEVNYGDQYKCEIVKEFDL